MVARAFMMRPTTEFTGYQPSSSAAANDAEWNRHFVDGCLCKNKEPPSSAVLLCVGVLTISKSDIVLYGHAALLVVFFVGDWGSELVMTLLATHGVCGRRISRLMT